MLALRLKHNTCSGHQFRFFIETEGETVYVLLCALWRSAKAGIFHLTGRVKGSQGVTSSEGNLNHLSRGDQQDPCHHHLPTLNCDVITLTNAKNNDHPGSTSGPQQHHYFSDRKKLVHHCTIFLCSLDVGNTDDTDDQCRGPSIKDKDHLVGLLTNKTFIMSSYSSSST